MLLEQNVFSQNTWLHLNGHQSRKVIVSSIMVQLQHSKLKSLHQNQHKKR